MWRVRALITAGMTVLAGVTALGLAACQASASPSGPAPSPAVSASPAAGSASPSAARSSESASSPAASSQATSSSGAVAPAALGPAGGVQGPWRLRFDDEFIGGSLNTADWSTGWLANGITPPVNSYELECYDPAQVGVWSGALHLGLVSKPETCSGKTRPYAAGMVNSDGKFRFTYGFMEARVWMPGDGQRIINWPAFWADGQNWPTDGEIDVLEGLGGRACWHFLYPHGNPGGCEHQAFTNGWHTFGANWEPGSITYYYDGQLVGTVTKGITSAPMYLILNNATAHAYGIPVQVPATVRVDYVRVWQHPG
ncbi:MAG TPA: glycoside hydrolase family 16 protein [Streptosporangiaceae bacterium]|nr:glycoside hydrolase family 16 protein [Streptosporangiaceae bacterium]